MKLVLALAITTLAVSAPAQSRLPAGMHPPGCAAGLELPPGFCATVFADSVRGARHILVAPNGDVFVNTQGSRGQSGEGSIVALRDTNHDGKSDVRQTFGSGGGTGIALEGNFLYATSGSAIVRYPLTQGALQPSGKPDTIVSGLPLTGHHSLNFVVNGGTLFLNIGSRTNACQEKDRQAASRGVDPCAELSSRAGIWEFDVTKLNQQPNDGRRFATGLRNSVALTRNPVDGALYATVHGRDQLHDNWPDLFTTEKNAENPGEELVRIDRGADYGWPYCFYDVDRRALVLAPEYGGNGTTIGQCAKKTEPLTSFPGHWAPNGMLFYTGNQFPQQYRGGAFIAFHGSWNRAPLPQAGFRVVFQPFEANKPKGSYTTFADGFLPAPTTQRAQPGTHRPTGLAQAPDGSLYLTDDTGGTIWKITYSSASR